MLQKFSLQSVLAFIVVSLLSPPVANAQVAGFGSVTGLISDPSGAAVPDAPIKVHNQATGVTTALQTNASGIYNAAFLPPGTYDIQVDKTGFTRSEHKDLPVQVGRILKIDFALSLQTGAQTIDVTSVAPVIDPDKTEFSQQVDQNLIANLPIIGRRWDNFVLLTPGTTTDGGLVSYRGISGLYNNNSVDGANNNQGFFSEARGRSTVPYTYSLDSIEEFQVTASNYSAEFGQAAGGVVNAVTKSGTNALHGDLFYFLRYPALNALDSYSKSQGKYTQAIHQQQQFGGSVGGALIKDKLFYFFTYDGSRRVFPIVYTTSAVLPLPCSAQATASQCALANRYVQSLTGQYPRTAIQDLGFGKLDYQLNANNRLSASFDLDDFHSPNAYNSNTSAVNNSITANGTAVTHTRFLVANWDATFRSNAVNNFRFQWAQDNEIIGNNAPGPSVNIANVTSYGDANALPRPAFPDEHRLQFADTMSWSLGKHQVKAGFDFNDIHELLINLFQGAGVYNYSGSQTAAFDNWVLDVFNINTGASTGRHYSSFAQVTDPITHVGKDDFYDNDVAGFVEDSWKVQPNVTLNLGLRYDIQLIPQPPRPNTATPLTTLYTSTINIDTNNIAPRLGLAWQASPTTVVRAGYGIFYAKTTNSTYYASRVENGVFQQTFNCAPTTLAISCPALTFPNLIFTPPGGIPVAPFAGAATPQITPFTPPAATQLSHGLTPDFVNPFVHEAEVALEQQLPGRFALSTSWLFSRAQRLPVFTDVNVARSSATHTYDVLSRSGSVLQQVTVPWYTSRLNPGTGEILNGSSVVNSNYNALAVTLRRPADHGIEIMLNYTFSKSLDDGAVSGANGTFYGTDPPLDPYNQKAEYGLSDLDQRHRLVGSLVYTPQIFKSLGNRFLRSALDGFVFSGIATVASGQPVFATVSGFPSGGVDFGLTGGAVTNTGGSTGGRPAQYQRNEFIAPPLHNFDARVMREFPVTERVHLQFLGEAFNVFNHTNVQSVNGTAFSFSSATSCAAARSDHSNGCLVPSPVFLTPTSTTSTNGLYGSRQLQVSAKLTF